jgi:hypothetical protein
MINNTSDSFTMHFTFEATNAFLLSKRGEMRFECSEFRRGKGRVADSTRGEEFVKFSIRNMTIDVVQLSEALK